MDFDLNELDREIAQSVQREPEFIKKDSIPRTIPLEKEKWIVVDNVASVFVDLTDSTKLVVGNKYDATAVLGYYAKALIRVFENYDSAYLDYQGDGGFSLFDGKESLERAMECAITLNTLFNEWRSLNVRIGIDIGRIYVKKVGIRGNNKELWLGKPVSYSSKLCNSKGIFYPIHPIRMSKKVYNLLNLDVKQGCEPVQDDMYHTDLIWRIKG